MYFLCVYRIRYSFHIQYSGLLTVVTSALFIFSASLGVNGVSPTINPVSNVVVTQRQGEMLSGLFGNGGKVISNIIAPRDKESSVSETTVETTITASPSEPPAELCLGERLGEFG